RGGPGRLPIHSVEDDEKDVLLSRREGRALNGREIGLVEVVGSGIERVRGNSTKDSLQRLFASIDAARPQVTLDVDSLSRPLRAERVNRNQPAAVTPPLRVFRRISPPVAERRGPIGYRRRLQFSHEIIVGNSL